MACLPKQANLQRKVPLGCRFRDPPPCLARPARPRYRFPVTDPRPPIVPWQGLGMALFSRCDDVGGQWPFSTNTRRVAAHATFTMMKRKQVVFSRCSLF